MFNHLNFLATATLNAPALIVIPASMNSTGSDRQSNAVDGGHEKVFADTAGVSRLEASDVR